MANSYGQFTCWVSVSDILKSEPSCTSHKPRASFQRWQVGGDLQHGKCPHAATQSYAYAIRVDPYVWRSCLAATTVLWMALFEVSREDILIFTVVIGSCISWSGMADSKAELDSRSSAWSSACWLARKSSISVLDTVFSNALKYSNTI